RPDPDGTRPGGQVAHLRRRGRGAPPAVQHRRGRFRMKVARFYAPGDLRLEDVPEPSPGPGEVKIRVRNCSTCGTDVKIFKHGHHHIVPPRVMGHEIAGLVTESTVDEWRPGDRVQVIAAVPCGTCPDCVRGRMTVCPNQTSV